MTWKKPTIDWSQWIWHIGALVLFFALSNGFYRLFHDGYMLYQPDIVQYRGMAQESKAYELLHEESVQWSNSMFGGMPTYQSGGEGGTFDWSEELRKGYSQLFAGSEIGILLIAMFSAYLLAIALGASAWWGLLAGLAFGFSTILVLYLGAGHRSKVWALSFMPGVVLGVVWAYRGLIWRGVSLVVLFLSLHLLSNHFQMTYYLILFLGTFIVSLGIKRWREGRLQGFLRSSVMLLLAAVLSSLPSSLNILNTQSYSTYTTRGKAILDIDEDGLLRGSDGSQLDIKELAGSQAGANSGDGLGDNYILEYSMAKMEWLAVMCPDFKGGATRAPANIQGQIIDVPVYWGEQKYSAGAFYFGVVVMAFFFLFLFIGRHWLRWPFLVLTGLAIVLSWRDMSFLMELFLDYLPLFDKFRDTKMMLVLVQLMSGMGAVLMLKELVEMAKQRGQNLEAWTRDRNRVLMGMGGLVAVFAFFYAFPTALLDFRPGLRSDMLADYLTPSKLTDLRVGVFRADVARTIGLLLIAAAGAALLMWGKVKPQYIGLVLVATQAVDVWKVNNRYHDNEVIPGQPSSWVSATDYAYPFKPQPVHLDILQREKVETPSFIETRDRLLKHRTEMYPRRVRPADREFLKQSAEFDALREEGDLFRVFHFQQHFSDAETSYFFQSIGGYHGAKLQRYQDFMEFMLADEMKTLSKLGSDGKMEEGLREMWGYRMLNTKYIIVSEKNLIPMVDPFGPAWFVNEVDWVETPNDEAIQTKLLRSKTRAIVPARMQDDAPHVGNPGAHSIAVEQHDPEYIRYQVQSENGGLMVCSEVYYPLGWKLYVDGEEAPMLRANFLFRAVSVPPGNHTVEMRFEPTASSTAVMANVGSWFSLIFFLFASVWSFREDQTAEDL